MIQLLLEEPHYIYALKREPIELFLNPCYNWPKSNFLMMKATSVMT